MTNSITLIAANFGPMAEAAVHAQIPPGYYVTPGSIEASEVQGQKKLVASTVLPSEMMPSRAVFEALGFVFGEPTRGDELFVSAHLPTGWTKRASGQSMWSDILDEKGRARVAVFYKVAVYDRRAHMILCVRYEVTTLDYEDPGTAWQIIDKATRQTLYESTNYKDAERWLQAYLSGRDRFDWETM